MIYMNIEKPRRKPKNRFIKGAILALAIGAGSLFYSHKESEKAETTRFSQNAEMQTPQSRERRRDFRSLSRRYASRLELQKVIDNARNIPTDLDYNSFDCRLVPKEVDPLDKKISFLMINTSVSPILEPGESYKFFQYHMPSGYLQRDEELKLNNMGHELEKLKAENDVVGIVKMLSKFHELNLVWDGEQNLETLAGVYLDMYDGAKQGIDAPDLRCVMKNLHAFALLQDAISALEGIVCQRYRDFRSSFGSMPESLLRHVSFRCFLDMKSRAFQKDIEESARWYQPDVDNVILAVYGSGSNMLQIIQEEIQITFRGYKDPGFKRFYAGERMDQDSLTGEKEEPQRYELLKQQIAIPIKYGIGGDWIRKAYPWLFKPDNSK